MHTRTVFLVLNKCIRNPQIYVFESIFIKTAFGCWTCIYKLLVLREHV